MPARVEEGVAWLVALVRLGKKNRITEAEGSEVEEAVFSGLRKRERGNIYLT